MTPTVKPQQPTRVQIVPPPDEFQPANSIFQNYVLPDSLAGATLSGGRTKPYYYYLGSNSTIPFVRLESSTSQKEMSWGDIVEVLPGQNVNVRNISYMPGDLQIQSGTVPVAPPRRVTLPVHCDVEIGLNKLTIAPRYPCDTRRAIRAYFALGMMYPASDSSASALQFSVSGQYRQHTKNPQTTWADAYYDTYIFTDMRPDIIPLGISLDAQAMRLADFAKVVVTMDAAQSDGALSTFVDAFYVLEY